MKKTTTTLASLAIAASAAAHSTAIPHTHSGWEINWQTVFTGVAALMVSGIALAAYRNAKRRQK